MYREIIKRVECPECKSDYLTIDDPAYDIQAASQTVELGALSSGISIILQCKTCSNLFIVILRPVEIQECNEEE